MSLDTHLQSPGQWVRNPLQGKKAYDFTLKLDPVAAKRQAPQSPGNFLISLPANPTTGDGVTVTVEFNGETRRCSSKQGQAVFKLVAGNQAVTITQRGKRNVLH
jgi:hypothetical protein